MSSVIRNSSSSGVSWKLASVYRGSGGSAGWMTYQDKQSIFTVINNGGWAGFNALGFIDESYPNNGSWGGYIVNDWAVGSVILEANKLLPIDKIRINVSNADYRGYIYVWDENNLSWVNVFDTVGAASGDKEVVLNPSVVTSKIKVDIMNWGTGGPYLNEIHISLFATVVIHGVPVGSKVRVFDMNNILLEEVINNNWKSGEDTVMLTSQVSNISRFEITKPGSNNKWLEFNISEIDGWDSNSWNVLDLYTM